MRKTLFIQYNIQAFDKTDLAKALKRLLEIKSVFKHFILK